MTVGGKTGTAVGGEANPHAWSHLRRAEDGQSVVMAVLVENAGHGSRSLPHLLPGGEGGAALGLRNGSCVTLAQDNIFIPYEETP
jgi:phage-related minor tail protein